MKAAFPMGLKNASIGPTTCQENWIFTVLLCLTSNSIQNQFEGMQETRRTHCG